MTWAAMFLAASLIVAPRVSATRLHSGPPRARTPISVPAHDPLAAAASLDVFAACLRSGMAVSAAAAAVADSAPDAMGVAFRRAADMLALGADPARAWANPVGAVLDHVDALSRMARRSASSGTALAQGVEDLAVQLRAEASDAASARAERAAVLMAGPLGVCYLPAFLCLGIVPVVAGLAGEVLQSGVL